MFSSAGPVKIHSICQRDKTMLGRKQSLQWTDKRHSWGISSEDARVPLAESSVAPPFLLPGPQESNPPTQAKTRVQAIPRGVFSFAFSCCRHPLFSLFFWGNERKRLWLLSPHQSTFQSMSHKCTSKETIQPPENQCKSSSSAGLHLSTHPTNRSVWVLKALGLVPGQKLFVYRLFSHWLDFLLETKV